MRGWGRGGLVSGRHWGVGRFEGRSAALLQFRCILSLSCIRSASFFATRPDGHLWLTLVCWPFIFSCPSSGSLGKFLPFLSTLQKTVFCKISSVKDLLSLLNTCIN